MTILDRSQQVEKDFLPVYELLDGLASEYGEDSITALLKLADWYESHLGCGSQESVA